MTPEGLCSLQFLYKYLVFSNFWSLYLKEGSEPFCSIECIQFSCFFIKFSRENYSIPTVSCSDVSLEGFTIMMVFILSFHRKERIVMPYTFCRKGVCLAFWSWELPDEDAPLLSRVHRQRLIPLSSEWLWHNSWLDVSWESSLFVWSVDMVIGLRYTEYNEKAVLYRSFLFNGF